ncbi:MAG: hypothetical protein EB830_04000 [Nitrosopumilus sp. H13]|nr:MAG: hypothetical protein EB830_04000 [Nitrosopumilus sp. H13]
MDTWADYLISAVSYDKNRLIRAAIRHADAEHGIADGEAVGRMTISSDIKKGLQYCTMHSGKDTWRCGSKILSFSIGGKPYLRVDSNRVKMDNLGDIPETDAVPPSPKELKYTPDARSTVQKSD